MTRFLDQVKAQQMSLDEEGKKIHRQTFLHFVKNLASASESTTTICRDGKSYDAAFHTGTPFPGKDFQVCLKVTRCLDEAGRVAPSKHVSPGSTLILASKDWASIKAKKLSLKRDNAAELQTDGAIRGRDLSHLEGRDLKSVANEWLDPETSSGLDASEEIGNWNQFDANAKLSSYKKSTFDENLYTKRLDKSSLSRSELKEADRKAAEILGQVSSNSHLNQERGHALEGGGDGDEEALFSGVQGTGGFKQGGPIQENAWKRGFATGGGASSTNNKQNSGSNVTNAWTSKGRPQVLEAAKSSTGPPPGLKSKTSTSADADKTKKVDADKTKKEKENKKTVPVPVVADSESTDEKKKDEPKALSAATKEWTPSAVAKEFKPKAPAATPVYQQPQQHYMMPNGQMVPAQMMAPPPHQMYHPQMFQGMDGQGMPMNGQQFQHQMGPNGQPMQMMMPAQQQQFNPDAAQHYSMPQAPYYNNGQGGQGYQEGGGGSGGGRGNR